MNIADLESLYIQQVQENAELKNLLVDEKRKTESLEKEVCRLSDQVSSLKKINAGIKKQQMSSINQIVEISNSLEDAKEDISKMTDISDAVISAFKIVQSIDSFAASNYQHKLTGHLTDKLHKFSVRRKPEVLIKNPELFYHIVKKYDLMESYKDNLQELIKKVYEKNQSDLIGTATEEFQLEIEEDSSKFHFLISTQDKVQRISSTPVGDLDNISDVLVIFNSMIDEFAKNGREKIVEHFSEAYLKRREAIKEAVKENNKNELKKEVYDRVAFFTAFFDMPNDYVEASSLIFNAFEEGIIGKDDIDILINSLNFKAASIFSNDDDYKNDTVASNKRVSRRSKKKLAIPDDDFSQNTFDEEHDPNANFSSKDYI